MNRLKEYDISFSGLGIGTHQFEFEIDDSFFDNFEYSEIRSANVHFDVSMERKERMLVFTFDFNGTVHTICNRCAEEFDLEIGGNNKLVVKFGHENMEESEDVVVIPDTEYHFNVAPYMYEFLELAVPIKVVHPDDENGNSTCNPDMLRRIEEFSPKETTDPRWEALSRLKRGEDLQ